MSGMSQIIGQHKVVQSLRSFGSPLTKNGGTPGHILIVGQRGMGKRTIARAFAEEFELSVVEMEAQALKGEGDLAAVLPSLQDWSVLLVSNIQEIPKVCIDPLTEALENFRTRVESQQGAASPVPPVDLHRFTCIATAPRETDCSPKLQKAFSLSVQLQAYTRTELEQIVQSVAESMGLAIQPSVAKIIAGTCDGNPRRIRSMLVQLSRVTTNFPATEEDARRAFGLPDEGKRYDQTIARGKSLQQPSGIGFEESITGLLQRMGFRTEMTKASWDGGLDIVAVLDKPLVGGRYLIQCKKFERENLVGAPTVREFFGALNADRKAVKGILITTSGFTDQAKEFAADVGLELIDGEGLRALMGEQNWG